MAKVQRLLDATENDGSTAKVLPAVGASGASFSTAGRGNTSFTAIQQRCLSMPLGLARLGILSLS